MPEAESTTVNRAVVYAGGGVCRFEPRPLPAPEKGEMVLGLRCCGLCGTDLFKLDHDTIPAGTVLGHEVVSTS
jgi:L-iditol 2-dehydrogenase